MPEIIPNWHPIFVHFSVALLSLTVLLHLMAHFSSGLIQEESRIVARWTLWLGALAAIVTGLAGIVAYNTVTHDTPSHLAMNEHRNWALPTIGLFLLLAVWSFMQTWKSKPLGTPFLVMLVLAGGLLASTAWHGAELVYRYGLGVMSLPKAEDHQHAADNHGNAIIEEHHNDTEAAPQVDDHHDDGHDHQH